MLPGQGCQHGCHGYVEASDATCIPFFSSGGPYPCLAFLTDTGWHSSTGVPGGSCAYPKVPLSIPTPQFAAGRYHWDRKFSVSGRTLGRAE